MIQIANQLNRYDLFMTVGEA